MFNDSLFYVIIIGLVLTTLIIMPIAQKISSIVTKKNLAYSFRSY